MKAHEFANTLRECAAWWDEHPDLPAPGSLPLLNVWLSTKDELRDVARQLSTTEKGGDESLFWLRVKLPLGWCVDFNVPRDQVCTAHVVGIRTVPARAAEPEREEEIVKWVCEPLLGGDAP